MYSIIFASQGLFINMGSGVDRKPLASEDGTLFSFDIFNQIVSTSFERLIAIHDVIDTLYDVHVYV